MPQNYVWSSLYLYGYLEQGKTQKERSVFSITYFKNLWQIRFENLMVKEKKKDLVIAMMGFLFSFEGALEKLLHFSLLLRSSYHWWKAMLILFIWFFFLKNFFLLCYVSHHMKGYVYRIIRDTKITKVKLQSPSSPVLDNQHVCKEKLEVIKFR